MSDATRAIALQEAVKVSGGKGDPAAVIAAAEKFNTFMTADSKPATVSVPGAEPAAPAPRVPPKPVKPPTQLPPRKPPVKPVKAAKPVKTEDELVAEAIAEADAEQEAADAAAAEAEGEQAEGATLDDVGQVISDLLAAKKRNEVIALLKEYGATSKSGVPAESYDEFVAKGNELLAE